jgi:radical SAM protein with 4Fe4S-binding SPASM domain
VAHDVPLVPEIPYSEFQERIGVTGNSRFPIEGVIETTFRCNLRCVHCYVNEAAGDAEIEAQELPLERLKRLVDEVAEAGTIHLLFTGGEVLVRADFPELYLYAIRKGLLVTLFTNGTMVTEKIADLLDEYRPEAVEISLYGMTRETYERVTGIPGSYDKCRIPLKLKSMALSWNIDEIPAMEAYARSLGLPFKFDGLLNPRVDCGANRKGELQVDPEKLVALELQDSERMREYRELCAKFVPPPEEFIPNEKVYTCGAGATNFTVDPYGKMQMCQLSRKSFFDLREGTFDTGWNEFFPMLRERTWQTHSVCRTCNLVTLCGSCPGAAEMETGSIEAMVASFCEIAHLRADAILGASSGHRRDATCCLGHGALAAQPDVAAKVSAGGGCGSCSHNEPAPPSPLIQIQRSR